MRSSRWLDIDQFFLVFLLTEMKLRSIKVQKRMRLIFSHLVLMFVVWNIIIYVPLIDRRLITLFKPFFRGKEIWSSEMSIFFKTFGPYSKLRTANWPIAWRKQTQPYNKRFYCMAKKRSFTHGKNAENPKWAWWAHLACSSSSCFVTNSYGKWDSSCDKSWVPVQNQWVPVQKQWVLNWKCLGLYPCICIPADS